MSISHVLRQCRLPGSAGFQPARKTSQRSVLPTPHNRMVGLCHTIVMGTDYPYPWTSTAVEHILGTPSLSDAERAATLGDTACKLLRLAS